MSRLLDLRHPAFWILLAAMAAVMEWTELWSDLAWGAHVDIAAIALLVAAVVPSLLVPLVPRQARRSAALAFALVLCGGLVVLAVSWKAYAIQVKDSDAVYRAFWDKTKYFWEIHFGAGLAAFLGIWWLIAAGVIANIAAIVLLGIQARKPSLGYTRSKQNVHGKSDWLTMREAKILFPAAGEIVIGEAYRVDQDSIDGGAFDKSDPSTWGQGGKAPLLCMDVSDAKTFASSHGLFFAGSGGFKTVSSVIPTCLKWRGGMVLLDPSGEILPMVRRFRHGVLGKEIIVIDPRKPIQGFNVLDWIDNSKQKEKDIMSVAGWLMPEKPDVEDSTGQTFTGQARNLIAGLIGHVLLDKPVQRLGEDGKPVASLRTDRTLRRVRAMLALPKNRILKEVEEIAKTSNSRFVREMLGQFANMTEATFSGVHFNASGATAWLSIDEFAKLVCDGNVRTSDIISGKYDVFINIDLQSMMDMPGLARLLIGALVNAVMQAEGQIPGRLVFLIDEAHTLGYMKILETVRDGMRKYRITLILIYQSIAKLKECFGRYGQQNWLDNVSFISFASIGDLETAREVSAHCGNFTVEVENKSKQWGWFSNVSVRQGETTNLQSRALVRPEELLSEMRADEQIVLVKGRSRIRCGRAIYFRRPEMAKVVGANKFTRI
ncbi:type IV secretion system protein VirD4 [Rhizobiales bacterium GAS191]|nr:type IV secretion system protein VirD4 [Rhizobiales bacterium GAS191]